MGHGSRDIGPTYVEERQVFQFRDGTRDLSDEERHLVKPEGLEVLEIAHGVGDVAGEIAAARNVKFNDTVGGLITLENVTTIGHVRGYRREGVRIREGIFEFQEGSFVIWVTSIGIVRQREPREH